MFDVPPGAAGSAAVGGGWIGYLSYPDAGADGRPPRIPEAAGGWTDCVLRQDCDGHVVVREPLRRTAFDMGGRRIAKPVAAEASFDIAWGDADRDVHRRGVLECLEAIAAGEIYQACVCTQFAGRLDGEPVDFFVDAVARTSPARAAFWQANGVRSPRCRRSCSCGGRGEEVTSSPIKGTLPRTADPAALRASVKDVAENIMIVDLVRNDLSRVAATGR